MKKSKKESFKDKKKDLDMPPKKKFCRVPSHLKKVKGKKKRVRVKGYIRKCR